MAKEKIIIDYQNKNAILKCSPHILKLVREKFSVQNPVYMRRRFDPRKYVITPSGAFQIGLWEEIEGFITSLQIPIEIILTPDFKNNYSPAIYSGDLETIEGYTYYDYQEESIRLFLERGRGIGLLATSSGKTLILGGLCKNLIKQKPNSKILIIVPDIGLLNQTYNEFVNKFGISEITQWGNKKIPDWSKNILIANSQMLISDIKLSVSKLKDYDYVIVDEVHTLGEKTNKINKIVHNIYTPNKFGLTGTLPSNLLACWNILGKMGPILIEESSFNIKEKGRAAPVEIHIIRCKIGKVPDLIGIDPFKPTDEYNNECQYIYTHVKRNDMIINIAEKVNGNVLVIVDKLLHGDTLMKYKTKKDIVFINGDMSVDEREKIIHKMENGENCLAVAMAQIFARGISINNLKYIIFCAIGKSNIRVCQAIGRSMRLHKNKTMSYIFDISDDSYYSQKHLKERLSIYKEEKIPIKIKNINL